MRNYAGLTDGIEDHPDTVHRIVLTGGSSAQAMDWGSTLSKYARFTGISSTGAAALALFVNLVSTHAAVPTSGTSATTGTSAGSTGTNLPVGPAPASRMFRIPAWSTGFSVAAFSSGIAIVEVWRQ